MSEALQKYQRRVATGCSFATSLFSFLAHAGVEPNPFKESSVRSKRAQSVQRQVSPFRERSVRSEIAQSVQRELSPFRERSVRSEGG